MSCCFPVLLGGVSKFLGERCTVNVALVGACRGPLSRLLTPELLLKPRRQLVGNFGDGPLEECPAGEPWNGAHVLEPAQPVVSVEIAVGAPCIE